MGSEQRLSASADTGRAAPPASPFGLPPVRPKDRRPAAEAVGGRRPLLEDA